MRRLVPVKSREQISAERRDAGAGEGDGGSAQGVICVLLQEDAVFVKLQAACRIGSIGESEDEVEAVDGAARNCAIDKEGRWHWGKKTVEGLQDIVCLRQGVALERDGIAGKGVIDARHLENAVAIEFEARGGGWCIGEREGCIDSVCGT